MHIFDDIDLYQARPHWQPTYHAEREVISRRAPDLRVEMGDIAQQLPQLELACAALYNSKVGLLLPLLLGW